MVPGGGGFAAINTIKSLKMAKFDGKIITTDFNPLSAGFFLADKHYLVPKAEDEDFFEVVQKIIEKENVKIVFPTSGFDIIPYSKNRRELMEKGVIPIVSNIEVVLTCLNKLKFYEKTKNKFDLPYTTANHYEIERFPCILKPVFGKGSRNVFLCKNWDELDFYLERHDDLLIQEYLPGTEYTIDVLSDLKGKSLVAIPRERIETKEGISFKGKTYINEDIQNECLRLAEFLRLIGPSCIQMKLDALGNPNFLEVNPRMGGGTIMTTYAGVNFPKLIVDMINNKKIKINKTQEITMLRYYEEVILDGQGRCIRIR